MYESINKNQISLSIKQYRTNSLIVGLLFIFATVLNVIGVNLSKAFLDDPNFISIISANENQVLIGGIFEVVSAFACAGIAIWLYPVLKRHNEGLALESVGLRIIEAIFYIIAVLGLLLLLTLSQEYVKGGYTDTSWYQTFGNVLLAGRTWSAELGVIAFTFGGLMYYFIFYQSKLIPRWLSGWGIIATGLTLITALLTIFGQINNLSMIFILLNLPLAVQEMILAVWLIVKGFNTTTMDSYCSKPVY